MWNTFCDLFLSVVYWDKRSKTTVVRKPVKEFVGGKYLCILRRGQGIGGRRDRQWLVLVGAFMGNCFGVTSNISLHLGERTTVPFCADKCT